MHTRPTLEYVGEGNDRQVYLSRSGKYVIKVPLHFDGETANYNEFEIYQRSLNIPRKRKFASYAKCRLINIKGITCLIMEFIKHGKPLKYSPRWVDYIDCGQVGFDKKGRLVAYDFG